jgi:hypothetical protein
LASLDGTFFFSDKKTALFQKVEEKWAAKCGHVNLINFIDIAGLPAWQSREAGNRRLSWAGLPTKKTEYADC